MSQVQRRRMLLAAAALLAKPGEAFAQQPGRVYRIGLFMGMTEPAVARQRAVIARRLATHGFVEGRNLQIDTRIGNFMRPIDADVARSLVDSQPDAILVESNPLALRVSDATKTIPTIFSGVVDPVSAGLVRNFSRPGGNMTGVHFSQVEIGAKRLELLRELLPRARRVMIADIFGADYVDTFPQLRQVAARLGFELIEAGVNWIHGFEDRMGALSTTKPDAIISGQPWLVYGLEQTATQIMRFAADRRIASVVWESDLAERGATLAYGVNPTAELARAADLLAAVLKGAKPGELPVHQATNYELVVNRKAAKALGITVPGSILVRAHRVIE